MKPLLFLLLSLSLFTIPAHAAILVFSPNGAYVAKPDLATAATAADTAGKTVVVTSAIVFSNVSSLGGWPADRKLKIEKGGSLTTSQTLRIRGPFEAGAHQVFTGTGNVVFGSGSIKEAYPEWWGADATGAIDSGPAIRKAVAAGGVPKVVFSPGTYKIGVVTPESAYLRIADATTAHYGIRLQKGIQLTSATNYQDSSFSTGDIRTTLDFVGTGAQDVGIYLDASNISISGLTITMDGATGHEWGIRGWGAENAMSDNVISASNGIHIRYSLYTSIIHNWINAPWAGIVVDRGTSTEIHRNYLNGYKSGTHYVSGTAGIQMGDPATSSPSGDTTLCSGNIAGNIIEYYDTSLYLSPAHGTLAGSFSNAQFLSQQIIISGNYFEAMGTRYLYTNDANFVAKDNITLTATGSYAAYSVNWTNVSVSYQQVTILDTLHVPILKGLFIGQVSGGPPVAGGSSQIVISPDRYSLPALRLFSNGQSGDSRKAEIELGDTSTANGWRVRYDRDSSSSLSFYSYSGGVETLTFRIGATIPVYADNSAATSASLAVGTLYRTATGQLMIRY